MSKTPDQMREKMSQKKAKLVGKLKGKPADSQTKESAQTEEKEQ